MAMCPALQSILEHFSSPHEESLGPLASTLPRSPQHCRPHFPSPWIPLFWAFRVNGAILHVASATAFFHALFKLFHSFPKASLEGRADQGWA